jgi:hypothetical protein
MAPSTINRVVEWGKKKEEKKKIPKNSWVSNKEKKEKTL